MDCKLFNPSLFTLLPVFEISTIMPRQVSIFFFDSLLMQLRYCILYVFCTIMISFQEFFDHKICRNGILLHSGLNPAWHFWLSEDEISWEHFRVYSRTILHIFKRLEKIFEIVQENILKCSKLIHFQATRVEFKPECLAWSCHYATGCFVTFLGDISILKSGCNTKKLFCCPGLELFHFLLLWNTVIFVSSRAFLLSTPLDNSEDTRKNAKICNK